MKKDPSLREFDTHIDPLIGAAKLLYVDDEPVNLALFKSTFGDEFQILVAVSGEEALKCLERESDIACLITDQRMPGMSGTELLAIVRETFPQMLRMIISAWSDSEILMEAVNKGHIYRYLTKPWHAVEVRQCLRGAVEKYFLEQERERLLVHLKESNGKLQKKALELTEANTALKAMLRQGTVLKEEMEENVFANVHESILPLLQKLQTTPLDDRQSRFVELLEKSLAELTSPFSRNLSYTQHRLTAVEKQIAGMVCAGNTSKEISSLLGLSPRTVETHRYRIRNKLGVNDRRTCLRELLSTLFS
jgi:DNA-binding NarL/FixJ family response regulator